MEVSKLRVISLLLLLLCIACTPAFEREIRVQPQGKHNLEADRSFCRDYAERYGMINLGPMMGDRAQNQPDRQRRDRLYILCMQGKGYGF